MAHLSNKTGTATEFTCDILHKDTFTGRLTVFYKDGHQVVRAKMNNGNTTELTAPKGQPIGMDEITNWVRTLRA